MVTATLILICTASAPAHATFLTDDTPRRIRLVDDPAVAPVPNYDGWTKNQLRDEYDRLEGERPGLGLYIGMIAGGGGAAVLGGFNLLSMFAFSSGTASVAFVALYAIV